MEGSLDLPWENYGIERDGETWWPAPKIEQASMSVGSSQLNCGQNSGQVIGGVWYAGLRNTYVKTTSACTYNSFGTSTSTLNACLSDPNEFKYFDDGNPRCNWMPTNTEWEGGSSIALSGPNINCPSAMLGLSSDPDQLYTKLDHMYPTLTGTKVDVGLMWGLRALSDRSDWATFWGLPSGQEAAAFDDFDTRKVMILLTDGKNEFPTHYEGYYGCLEKDGDRGSAGDCVRHPDIATDSGIDVAADKLKAGQSLNALMLDACERIREEYNVELYVIALDLTDTTAVSNLQACAADPSRFFSVSSADLDEVFENLAANSLRLTR